MEIETGKKRELRDIALFIIMFVGLLTRRLAVVSSISPPPIRLCNPIIINNTQQSCTPQITIRHATKKAGGSSNNGRDSAGRRLGIKVWPGTLAKAGSIIVRQRGKKFLVGDNVGMGKDHTVFAKVAGRVKMERSTKNRKRNYVHVVVEEEGAGNLASL